MSSRFIHSRIPAAALLALLLVTFMALGVSATPDDPLPNPAPGSEDAPPANPPAVTDNNTPGTATPLNCGAPSYGVIGANGEVDYFKIETGAEWPIVVTVNAHVNGSPLDAVLTLYDANGTTVLTDQDQFNGNDPRLHWTTSYNNPGGFGSRHYVRVHNFYGTGSSSHTYNIKWEYARYVSMTTAGTVDGVAYQPGDILTWTGCGSNTSLAMFFDASDVGITRNVRDFAVLNGDPLASYRHGTIVLAMPRQTIAGFGAVQAQDLTTFRVNSIGTNTAGSFQQLFDGSDVGLTTTAESIDGVAVRHAALVLSTTGNVSTISPIIAAKDEDALRFTPSNIGGATAGTWTVYFDGSDVGVPGARDLTAFWSSPAGYFTAAFDAATTLGGVALTPRQAIACDPGTFGPSTSCTWGTYHQGFSDPSLNATGAVLDGYDEGSHWWPFTLVAAVAEPAETRQPSE